MISSIDAERHLAKFNTHFIRKNKTLGKLEMRGNFLKLIKIPIKTLQLIAYNMLKD